MTMRMKTNEAIFDILLNDALVSMYEEELIELMSLSKEHTYSNKFEKTIKIVGNNINLKERSIAVFRITKKAIVTVAAVFGFLFGGFLTQPSVYAAVENVIKEIFSTNDSYTFINYNSSEEFDKNIKFGYVPYGYDLRTIYYNNNSVTLIYDDTNDHQIYFEYGKNEGTSISIDNETHKYEKIEKNSNMFNYYEAIDNNDSNILMWHDNYYLYCISAQLSKGEIVKIAENLKRTK